MKKIRSLIVDDEPLAREGLAVLLRDDPEVEIVGMCSDGFSALAEIGAGQPDLVFLDVQMPECNGLELYESLPFERRPTVVFVTAYDRYAVKAFELCAVDYVLKPFRDERFKAALARAKEEVRRTRSGELPRSADGLLTQIRRIMDARVSRLAFRSGVEHFFFAVDDIAWIEAQGRDVRIGVAGEMHMASESLQSVEQRLGAAGFVRIHRSFIVNIRCVRKITPAAYGDYTVLMNDGVKIRLSRTFHDRLEILLAGMEE